MRRSVGRRLRDAGPPDAPSSDRSPAPGHLPVDELLRAVALRARTGARSVTACSPRRRSRRAWPRRWPIPTRRCRQDRNPAILEGVEESHQPRASHPGPNDSSSHHVSPPATSVRTKRIELEAPGRPHTRIPGYAQDRLGSRRRGPPADASGGRPGRIGRGPVRTRLRRAPAHSRRLAGRRAAGHHRDRPVGELSRGRRDSPSPPRTRSSRERHRPRPTSRCA